MATPKLDLNLLGALVVFGVINRRQAELLEAVYSQRNYIPPMDLNSAIEVAAHTFDDVIEAEIEAALEAGEPLEDAHACVHGHGPDRLEPPMWWLAAHESWWHATEPDEDDCRG